MDKRIAAREVSKIISGFNSYTKTLAEIRSDIAGVMDSGIIRDTERMKKILKDIDDYSEVLTMVKELVDGMNPRTHSGGGPRMYWDAILDCWSDGISIYEVCTDGVKHLKDAWGHLKQMVESSVEMVKNGTKSGIDGIKSSIHTIQADSHAKKAAEFEMAADFSEICAGGAESMIPPGPAQTVAGGFKALAVQYHAQCAAEDIMAEKHAENAERDGEKSREEAQLAEKAAMQAWASMKEMGFSIWMALKDFVTLAFRYMTHMGSILAWAARVMAVPKVPKFPRPVCGRCNVDPYWWAEGQVVPSIFPEPIVMVENETSPTIIVQGTNKVKLVDDYILDDWVEFPTIGFDGGGTVF